MCTYFSRSVNIKNIPGITINDPPYDRIVKLLCSPSIERSSVHFAVGISIIPGGHIHEEHTHESEEVIFILSGHGEITINQNETVRLEPGTVILLHGNEPHSLINKSDIEDLQCLWVYSPPGAEKKFVGGAGCRTV